MEMTGQARLAASRELVWSALNDPRVLRASIPGCETLDRDGDDSFTTTVVSKVGPVKARFSGRLTLSNIDAPRSYTLSGEGSGGAAGFAKAQIDVALEAIESEVTLLRYGVNAQIGGKLAQLGSRMVDAAARKSADEFFAAFAQQVASQLDRKEHAPVQATEELLAGFDSESSVPALAAVPLDQSAGTDTTPACASDAEATNAGSAQQTLAAAASQAATEMLTAGHIKVWTHERIAVVTLNRPDRRNALSLAMWRALPPIMAALERNADVRAVVLTGAGADFSAGADIAEFDSVRADVEQATAYESAVDACCDAIMALAKPTVAVVRGYCLGGAMHLAMACDFRYASSTATFGIPAAKLSIVYGLRGTARLLALVGLPQAKRILFGGERFDAATALHMGLVDHIAQTPVAVPMSAPWWRRTKPAQPEARDPMIDARAFAATLADNAPLSIAGAKTMLDGLAIGRGCMDSAAGVLAVRRAAASDDYREGRAAFAQRRAPVFTGR